MKYNADFHIYTERARLFKAFDNIFVDNKDNLFKLWYIAVLDFVLS